MGRVCGWMCVGAAMMLAQAGCAEAGRVDARLMADTRDAFGPDPVPASGAAGCYLQILKAPVDVDGFCADQVVIQVGMTVSAELAAYELRAYEAITYPTATVSGMRVLNVNTSITNEPQVVEVSPCLPVPNGGHVAVANPAGPIRDSMDISDTALGGYWNLFVSTTNVTGESTELVGSFAGTLGWRVEGVINHEATSDTDVTDSDPAAEAEDSGQAATGSALSALLAATALHGLLL